ncbi:MAG: sigma-54 dependent transcriptional regulator [Myxococcota bacterium]|nr:sigma-54 dependent transcriptional regulator [Myxococcota bacterium]
MYTLLIDVQGGSGSIVDWMREREGSDSDLVVLDRDSVAAQLLRSDAPPSLVIRSSAADLDSSPLLNVSQESGRALPRVVVLCAEGEEALVRGLGDSAFLAMAHPEEPAALFDFIDSLVARADGDVAVRFDEPEETAALHFGCFIGESSAMQAVYRVLEKVAKSDSTCLITGESGTGKELAAQVVHDLSNRTGASFVPVNCGAIPENLLESEFFGHKKGAFTGAISDHAGRFETADRGTLFLDEIGEMAFSLQVKLLRALQTGDIQPVGSTKTKTVDVRVVAATNRDLEQEMSSGNFREDLYYRLAIIPIEMPALRSRPEDIPQLIRYFVGEINRRSEPPVAGMTRGCLDALCSYSWQGNIRELRAVLERMVVMAEDDLLSVSDLPGKIRSAVGLELDSHPPSDSPLLPESGVKLSTAVDEYETALILQALERTGWNKNQAARLLNMNRTTLVEKLKKKKLTGPAKEKPTKAAGAD